jgi:hypothetical protein
LLGDHKCIDTQFPSQQEDAWNGEQRQLALAHPTGAAVQAEVCAAHEGCVVITHDPLLQHTWKDHDPVDVAKTVLKP